MPLIPEYLTPVFIFVVFLGLALGIVARRVLRLRAGSKDLDRAQTEGRLSEDLRRRWDRLRIFFVLQILAIIALSVWVFYSLDAHLGAR